MNDRSQFLFPDSGFVEGMGRIFDFGDVLTRYNSSSSPAEADLLATTMDWNQVGEDFGFVIRGTREKLCQEVRGVANVPR